MRECFDNCSLLTSVTFENNSNLTTIKDGAFKSIAITNVIVPVSVTTLGNDILSGCDDLTDIYIEPNSNIQTSNNSFSDNTLRGLNGITIHVDSIFLTDNSLEFKL